MNTILHIFIGALLGFLGGAFYSNRRKEPISFETAQVFLLFLAGIVVVTGYGLLIQLEWTSKGEYEVPELLHIMVGTLIGAPVAIKKYIDIKQGKDNGKGGGDSPTAGEMIRSLFMRFFSYLPFLAPVLLPLVLVFGSHQMTSAREAKMTGAEYFVTPIKLTSSDINICSKKPFQLNGIDMLPIYDLALNYNAQLLRKNPDGSWVDVRMPLRSNTLFAEKGQPHKDYETDFREIRNGDLEPGTYKWSTAINFWSETGHFETHHYEGNPFELYCEHEPVTKTL